MRPIVTSVLRAALTLPLLAAVAAPAAAQTADSAGLVTVLGTDTLAMERWVRSGDRITAEAVIRSPRTTLRRYTLDLDSAGRMRAFEERVYVPGTEAPVRTETLRQVAGGWERTLTRGDTVQSAVVDSASADMLPWVDLVHWPFELALQRARGGPGGPQPFVSNGRMLTYSVTPIEGDGWVLRHPFRGPSTVRVDARGRLLSLDAAETTRKVVVTRVPWLELDDDAARWARADREGRGMGALSGRGRTEEAVGGANIVVDYGTPVRRGRDIFGRVVPWDEVWRTGANQATHFSSDRALVFTGADGAALHVPAGEYTLFSIPREDGGWLIVNRQTGQNGTSYDSAQDLGRVRMTRTTLDEPVEVFTIGVDSASGGGVLRLAWDRTAFTVPFRVP